MLLEIVAKLRQEMGWVRTHLFVRLNLAVNIWQGTVDFIVGSRAAGKEKPWRYSSYGEI